jgi:sulfur-oxidizing protein SoxY
MLPSLSCRAGWRVAPWRATTFAVALSVWSFAIPCLGATDREDPDNDVWRKLKTELFGERVIREEGGPLSISLALPARAADAATVPINVQIQPLPGQTAARKLYLIIDRNPSPLAGIFEFGEAAGRAELETRVRIEDYTWVRAIAETADGNLVGARRFIKAAGGCSAPAGKSLAQRLVGMGQMKWRLDDVKDGGQSIPVQLMIRHPNSSGLAMDQFTRLYDPPHFVRSVRVTRNEALVFSADVDFSISENPTFRFSIAPGEGDLRAEVTDSNDNSFESRTALPLP